MPQGVDTSSYPTFGTANAQPPNLLGFVAQAAQIRNALGQGEAIERENAEKRALGEVLTQARGPDGSFDMGKAVTMLSQNPLTAAKAPQMAEMLLKQTGMSEDNALKQLQTSITQQEIAGRAATGVLESRKLGPSGEWELGMEPVTHALATLRAQTPQMAGQIDALHARLGQMTDAERYRAVQVLAHQAMAAKDGLTAVGERFKFIPTPGGAVVAVDTAKPSKAQVVYEDPKPVALGAGQRLVNPRTGATVAEGSPFSAEIQSKVAALRANGVPQEVALGIASGQYKYEKDPVTQVSRLVDTLNGEPIDFAKGLREGSPAANVAKRFPTSEAAAGTDTSAKPGAKPIDLYGNASSGTGFVPSLKAAATEIVPQLDENLPSWLQVPYNELKHVPVVGQFLRGYPDIVQARQALNNAQNEFVRAFAVNSKLPVAEINRLRKEVDISPGWGSQTALQARMREVDTSVRHRINDDIATAQDKSQTVEARKDARNRVLAARNFLKILRVPQANDAPAKPEVVVPPALTSGATHEEMLQEYKRRTGKDYTGD